MLAVDLINKKIYIYLTPPHQRRVLLVGSDTHQGGITGKPNHDTSPPARALVCHLVLPSTTVVVHARRVRHSLCPAIQLPQPQCCLPLPCRCLPHLPQLLACPNQKLQGRSEISWRSGDWENTQPSGQGVILLRARSRLVLHKASKSLYGGDLGWFGGQLSPSLLALTWLDLQPICPTLRSETHTQSWFWRL